jgi:hypothetical protein
MSPRKCVWGETHFHKWGKVQGMNPMTPKCTPLKITFMWESQMLKTLVGKANMHQIGILKHYLERF